MKRPKKSSRRPDPKPAPPAPHAVAASGPANELPIRPWLLAGMTALFVARQLVPSEGVAWVGDGQPFCMLWLLLACLTCVAAIKAKGFPRRFNWLDGCVVAFAALYGAAAVRGTWVGNPRPAINMLWEVVTMIVSFLLVRQLVHRERTARAMVAVMVSLAVVVSIYGLYQAFVSMPADREEFARDPDGMLRRAGQWYPAGSPERIAFENRLASTEPLATFALTNSLAGFLLPWIVVVGGIALGGQARGGAAGGPAAEPFNVADGIANCGSTLLQRAWMAFAVLLPGFCLLLTKSRSGYVALAVAILLLLCNRFGQVLRSRFMWATVAILLIAIGATFASGLLDAQVATEAGKSLGYRLQYWQSTLAMIRDQPWLGVGPGNFQDDYTAYKLPEASEEIRDPHNWLLEIAATAGIPAAIVFCIFLTGALVTLVAAKRAADSAIAQPPRHDWFVAGGAAIGLLMAFAIGTLVGMPPSIALLVVGFVAGGAMLWLMRGWIAEGSLSPQLLAVAVVALLVHLLASGGMMYPAVAGSLWLLLGLGLKLPSRELVASRPFVPALALGLCATLTVSQYLTGYSPVLRSQGALLAAQSLPADAGQKENALLAAVLADPHSADPWQELAALDLQRWLAKPGPRLLDQFQQATERFLALKPRSSSAHRLVGNWWLEVFTQSGKAEHARLAADTLATAVKLYPNSAILRAESATALVAAGQSQAARAEAQAALRLDRTTPHQDKKLPEKTRATMQRLSGDSTSGSR